MEEQGKKLDEMVSLAKFAEMAGFPIELVKRELFEGANCSDEISVTELRGFMLKYLDKTMIEAES